jgi:hypothetical protein
VKIPQFSSSNLALFHAWNARIYALRPGSLLHFTVALQPMPSRKILIGCTVAVGLILAAAFGYFHWRSRDSDSARFELLSLLPADANSVFYLDLAQFRASPFLAELFAWVPQQNLDEDYKNFVHATGFNYERDLDRVAMTVTRSSTTSTFFAVADGRFDHKKIEAYARQNGKEVQTRGASIFSILPSGSQRPSYFMFLRGDRIAFTNDANYAALFDRSLSPTISTYAAEWREQFTRLAGTPLFVVLRQDPDAAAALAMQAPGGLRSPQLATLLSQLQWISIAGKPDGNLLRVVIDAQSDSEQATRQLNEMLNGLVLLAQGGLNDPKTRKQIAPETRDIYLQLLRSVDIKQIDRGGSKSVRIVFDITPQMLRSARESSAPTTNGPPLPAR